MFSLLLGNAIHMTFTFIYCGCCLLMCDSSSLMCDSSSSVSLSWVAFHSGHTWWSTWPRCSFIVCIYDSSSPVLSLNLGQLDVGPLELILPSQPHTHIHLSRCWICILFFHSLRKTFTFNLLNWSRQFLKVHLYVISFFFLRLCVGAGEIAHWSGVLTVLEESLSSISNTCVGCWQGPLWAPVLTDVHVCIIKNQI